MPFSSLRMAPTLLQRADASGLHLSNGGKTPKSYLHLDVSNVNISHVQQENGFGIRDMGYSLKFSKMLISSKPEGRRYLGSDVF